MYLKVMGNENLSDRHALKCFRIIECKEVSFYRDESGRPIAWVDGDEVALSGNAYILNANGKTIDSMECNAFAPPSLFQTPEGA
jgi:hypothetical protein